MDQLFRRLKLPEFLPDVGAGEFIVAATNFLAELNAIHPFREGNGRTQLVYLYLLGLRAHHPFRLDAIRRETFLPAMIQSFDRHLEPLIAELDALRA
jgi:cell filamentation protein